MTVTWRESALEDRAALLSDALDRAIAAPAPQIYIAAREQDARIEAEGAALDGVATYTQGPLPDSHVYTVKGGRFVVLYARDGQHVQIERVLPSRSNWRDDNKG